MEFGGADATVVVVREPALSGGAVAFTVKVDGVAGREKLMPNDRIRLQVRPGFHRLQLTMWSRQGSRTQEFEVGPGQVVGFVCRGSLSPLHPIEVERNDAVASGPAAGPSAAAPGFPTPPYGAQPFGSPPAGAPSFSAPSFGTPPFGAQPPRIEIIETGQFKEPLGEEVRVIDNRHSVTGVTRNVRASREWSRTVALGTDQTRTAGGELGGGPAWLRVKGSIEQELHRTYSADERTTRTFAEEITIEVPKQTSVRVTLRWKRIWQRGVARVTPADGGGAYDVPYQVVVNVTFDQSQQDVAPGTVADAVQDAVPAPAPAPAPAPGSADPTVRMYWTPPDRPDQPTR